MRFIDHTDPSWIDPHPVPEPMGVGQWEVPRPSSMGNGEGELHPLTTALRARTSDLDRVGNLGISILRRDMVGPSLDLGSFDLYRGVAVSADEVMMMLIETTSAVTDLTIVRPEYVYCSCIGEDAELVIHRRQPDSFPSLAEFEEELLC